MTTGTLQQAVGNSKNLKLVACALCAVILALCFPAAAQQPTKVPRIGYLTGNPFSNSPARTEALRQGLRELGYEEGKNILVEWRSAEGKLDRLPVLASEFVNLKVDVIVTQGPIATRATRNATTSIPMSWGLMTIQSVTGSSPVLRDPGGTLPDCQRSDLS